MKEIVATEPQSYKSILFRVPRALTGRSVAQSGTTETPCSPPTAFPCRDDGGGNAQPTLGLCTSRRAPPSSREWQPHHARAPVQILGPASQTFSASQPQLGDVCAQILTPRGSHREAQVPLSTKTLCSLEHATRYCRCLCALVGSSALSFCLPSSEERHKVWSREVTCPQPLR